MSARAAAVHPLRRCACGGVVRRGGECSACQAKRLGRSSRPAERQIAPPIVHDVLRSPGRPLDPSTRGAMEARLGHDFSRVRVHTDERAAQSAHAVAADAYTVGRNVVFAADRYRPATSAGATLLAHELAHVAQQGSSDAPAGAVSIGDPGDRLEADADAASIGAAGRPATTTPAGGPALRRQPKQDKPLIPMPVFDEFDPVVIVPDHPAVPSFLRRREIPISTLRKILEAAQGDLPSLGGPGQDFCATILPGYEQVPSGPLEGLCCPQFSRDRDRCCRWQEIGLMSFRCCRGDEIVLDGRCFRPQLAPVTPTPRPAPAPTPTPTPDITGPRIPRLELELPPIRFGSIQSATIDRFVTGRPEIPADAGATLDLLARQIALYRDATVHVEGHTDSTAGDTLNQRLSNDRAAAVRDALVARGVDARRLIVQGFGERQLLFPAERSPEEMARNRRVDVWLYIPPAEPALGGTLRPPGAGP